MLLKDIGNKATGDAPSAVIQILSIEARTLPVYAKLAAIETVRRFVTTRPADAARMRVFSDRFRGKNQGICHTFYIHIPALIPRKILILVLTPGAADGGWGRHVGCV